MESSMICERCKILTKNFHIFSCNHSLCSQCITSIIAFHHIKNIVTQDQLELICPCQKGTKKIKVADIPHLLIMPPNDPTICIKHGATSNYYCLICDLWLCEDCIEIHKIFNSHHQMTQEQIGYTKCTIHEGQIKNIYCHDCKEIICSLCILLRDSKHFCHHSQLISDYANELRLQIDSFNISDQLNWIEETRRDILRQVDCKLEKTMKKMDQLIQLVEESKQLYNEKMKQTLQRTDLLLNLWKVCYLDFSKRNQIENIYLLKDLIAWDKKFPQIKIQDEIEFKVSNFQKDLENCIKMRPFFEDIHAEWIIINWTKNPFTLTGHADHIYSLIQLSNGRIASASADKTIKIWEVNEFKNLFTLTGHTGYAYSLIQLNDRRLLSGSNDGTIKVWEKKKKKKTFKNTLTLTGHTGTVFSIIQLKDERILSGCEDKTIKVWEGYPFKNTRTLTGHHDHVYSLIQLKDGRIASGSRDKTIKIWEVKENEIMATLTLTGHEMAVCSLIQLRDGRIASGSGDKTIKVWEVKEAEFRNTFTLIGHTDFVQSLIQFNDGYSLRFK